MRIAHMSCVAMPARSAHRLAALPARGAPAELLSAGDGWPHWRARVSAWMLLLASLCVPFAVLALAAAPARGIHLLRLHNSAALALQGDRNNRGRCVCEFEAHTPDLCSSSVDSEVEVAASLYPSTV